MGTITLVVLGLTLAGMLFGAFFGLIRGRDRAILRLTLVILSAILALALRGVVVDTVMNISIDGATLQETLMESFASEDASIPQGLQNLIFALLEILIGFVAYFILLFALRFLTWLLLFPFLKLIIRKIEKKRAIRIFNENASKNAAPVDENTEAVAENTEAVAENACEKTEPVAEKACEKAEPVRKISRKERKKLVKKHRGLGALVGLVQGILVAYFLFAPLTCLVAQVDQLANIKIDGEYLFEMPEEIDLTEYSESVPGKIYKTTGHWFYSIMTTTTDADGNKVSLEGTLDSVAVIMEVADVTVSLEEDLKILEDENAEPEEVIAALDGLGDKLISLGSSMDELDDSTMDMIKDLVTEMGGEDVSQDEIDEILEMLTPEFFVQAGNGIKAFAEYEQVKLDGAELTQDGANDIVNKAYNCITIIEEMEFDVNEGDKAEFKTAIDSITDISQKDKDSLYRVFGIQTNPAQ